MLLLQERENPVTVIRHTTFEFDNGLFSNMSCSLTKHFGSVVKQQDRYNNDDEAKVFSSSLLIIYIISVDNKLLENLQMLAFTHEKCATVETAKLILSTSAHHKIANERWKC